jgi:SAM-dependent methyltransferase
MGCTHMSGHAPSIEQVKAAQRAAWSAGDFGVIASHMTAAGEHFAECVGSQASLPAGAAVLDVATGTGNVALPLARAGFAVTGLDLVPALLTQARTRAAAEGLHIQFDEGDAEALPYADGRFRAVTTMFGAMFAPQPQLVAAELARVLSPGGLLAMGNWTPDSFTGAFFRTVGRHAPPPPGIPAPHLWGDPAVAQQRLEAAGFHSVRSFAVPVPFRFAGPPAEALGLFRLFFGPTVSAFARLHAAGQAALASDLEQLWADANVALSPETDTDIPNHYLFVTAMR